MHLTVLDTSFMVLQKDAKRGMADSLRVRRKIKRNSLACLAMETSVGGGTMKSSPPIPYTLIVHWYQIQSEYRLPTYQPSYKRKKNITPNVFNRQKMW